MCSTKNGKGIKIQSNLIILSETESGDNHTSLGVTIELAI